MNLIQRLMAFARRTRDPGEPRIYVATRQGGVRVTEDTALTYSAVWAAVRVIAETVASLPWHVYQRSPTGRIGLPDHPVAWLLNSAPNPEMTAFSLRETLMGHVLLWGNGYAEIERDGANRPVALWPLAPDRVTAKSDAAGLYYEVRYDDDQATRVLPANMLHVHGLGFDGLVGYSVIGMARRSMGVGMAQDAFAQSFFGNGTALGGVIKVDGRIPAEQIEAMEADWNAKRAGPDHAMKVKVLGHGMSFEKIGMPMTDAQFLESRKFSVLEVARWFRVPPHKLADLERATFSNIEHQAIEFVVDTIVPWCARLEQEANAKLFGARATRRTYTKIALQALLRGDGAARAEFYRSMTAMGAMSINEVRELEELNSIGPAGDGHLVQLNQTTVERLIAGPPEPKPTQDDPPPEREDDPVESARSWRARRATDVAIAQAATKETMQ